MTAALEGGEWSAARPGCTLPPGKTRYPFYRKLGGPQGRSGRAENLVPTGIRSRTVHPVVHYRSTPDGGEWLNSRTGCSILGEEPQYRLHRRLGRTQSWSALSLAKKIIYWRRQYLLTYLLHGAESFLRS